MSQRTQVGSGSLSQSALRSSYLPEPLLLFGSDGLHVDPKSGIARYGPRSYESNRHPLRIRVGLIGTAEMIEVATEWMEAGAYGLNGDDKHPEFPGCRRDRGLLAEIEFDDGWQEPVSQTEIATLLEIRSSRERFEHAVEIFDTKLRLLAERDSSPDYVLLALSDDVVRRSGVVDYTDNELGVVHRDLRRALKSAAMKYRIPTQLIREQTISGEDPTHPSKIAWNFFTGMYFKAGGVPWGPNGLTPGTCYVGIGFYRPLGSRSPKMQTSLVQAFDEHGEGLVLRGVDFEWDSAKEGSRSPHLTEEQCVELVELVLTRYKQEMKQSPRRVVIHKTSRYWPAEREGFKALGSKVAQYDLVALERRSDVRLVTTTKYPPLRGTRFILGELDFLYTSGFIASLNEFHGVHVPAPLLISDHVGQDTPRETLLREIMALTKMNWNAANFSESWPITLKFSQQVAEIMREVPRNRDPLPQYKFYM